MSATSPYRRVWKREAAIAGVALAVLIGLPVVGFLSLTVSSAMAATASRVQVSPNSYFVEIYGASGEKVAEVAPSKVWPVSGVVSDEFHTHDSVRRWLGLGHHTGIDIAANTGTPVVAFMAGTVTVVDRDDGCGRQVRIDHGNDVVSIYCHLSSTSTRVGAAVAAGELIGRVGNTGISTGPHLHFQINVAGDPVDPRTFMVGDPPR